jgi:protein associated with RNAse G/E
MNLKDLVIGQSVSIQTYKHDGSIHRTWLNAKVLDIRDDHVVLINNRTWVVESDGRRWFTREPAISFFFARRWYNIIAMIRKNGITYYCNIASPTLYDGEAVKNIDYDLDVKVLPDGTDILLDEDEYDLHGQQMGYSAEMKDVIEAHLAELLDRVRSQAHPFDNALIHAYFESYQALKKAK